MASFTLDPQAALALGIVVGLLSTCVQSLGLTMQRKSHMLEDEKEDDLERRPPYRRRRWQIGMLLFLLANIVGSTIQIVALPLPLLSTLQASGLVFNSILATLILHEPWTWRSLYGTVLVAAGAVLVSYFSAVPEPSHNLAQLLDLFAKPNFLVWFCLSLAFAVMVIVITFTLRKCVSSHRREDPKVLLVNGMIFGLLSGILSAHALLLAKSAVELVVRSLVDRQNQFRTWEPWLLLVAFLLLSLSQLYYLHLGLKLISTSILYPFVFCIYNIVAILDGLIYFQQLRDLAPLHAGFICLGTILLLAGVLALSWRLQGDEPGERDGVNPEIPQTVLAPGMGFVGDPESESNDSDLGTDNEADELDSDCEVDERSTLIRKPLHGHERSHAHARAHSNKRRHRASTLKEVKAIWGALGDDDHHAAVKRPASAASTLPYPESQQRPRRVSGTSRLAHPARSVSLEAGLSRASTMPADSKHSRRRRRSSKHGSALFSDLLKSKWWTFKKDGENDDEPQSRSHSRPHSSQIT